MNTGLNKKRISQKFKKLLKNSLIVRFLLFLSEFFYSKITHSKIAQLFSSYSETGKCYNNSFLKFVVSKVGLKKNTRLIIKNKIQKNIENSIFYRAVCSLSDILLSAKVRMYGIALFIFGFCSVAAGLIKTYVSFSHGDDYFLIFQGALLVFIGFAFLFYKNSMGHLLYNSKIIWFLLHDIAGIEEEKTVRPTAKENTVLPVLLGLFLGLTSIVIDPIYIFVAFFAIIYIIFVFYKPEFGILVTIVTVPFLPTMLICFEILLAFASFLLKVLRGKRSIYFGLLDICVAVFAILMLLGGIFSAYPKTSIQASCVFVCFILSYFLVVNLVKSVSSLKKMIFLLSLSFFACSFLGVWQNFFGIADTTWTDVEMFEEINTRVVSTFENPNVFGEYLIMMAPMVLSLFFIGKGFKRKCVPALVFITGCAALYLHGQEVRGSDLFFL